jgi:hypothetical protein
MILTDNDNAARAASRHGRSYVSPRGGVRSVKRIRGCRAMDAVVAQDPFTNASTKKTSTGDDQGDDDQAPVRQGW